MLCRFSIFLISLVFLLCPPHPSLSLSIISHHFYGRPSVTINVGHMTPHPHHLQFTLTGRLSPRHPGPLGPHPDCEVSIYVLMGINGEWDEIWGSRHGTKWSEWNTDGEEGKERESMRMKTGEVEGRGEKVTEKGWFATDCFSSCVFWLRSAGPAPLSAWFIKEKKQKKPSEWILRFLKSVIALNCWSCLGVSGQS